MNFAKTWFIIALVLCCSTYSLAEDSFDWFSFNKKEPVSEDKTTFLKHKIIGLHFGKIAGAKLDLPLDEEFSWSYILGIRDEYLSLSVRRSQYYPVKNIESVHTYLGLAGLIDSEPSIGIGIPFGISFLFDDKKTYYVSLELVPFIIFSENSARTEIHPSMTVSIPLN